MPRHLFLTGNIQVGKSTLIQRFLSYHPELQLGGFRTVTRYGDLPDCKGGVYLLPGSAPFSGWETLCGTHNRVGIRALNGPPASDPAVFDALGPDLLQPRSCDLLLMDELGRMEQQANAFCAAVMRALDGHTPILGVIQPRAERLYTAISSHPHTALLTVTPANRDALLPELDALLTCAVDASRRYFTGNSAGAAVFRSGRVLLIRHGSRWSFPKGHIEANESEEAAALREVFEETGITARLLKGFRAELPSAKAGDLRSIIGFCAEYISGEVRPQAGETDEACWLTPEEALARVTFAGDRAYLADACRFISSR